MPPDNYDLLNCLVRLILSVNQALLLKNRIENHFTDCKFDHIVIETVLCHS